MKYLLFTLSLFLTTTFSAQVVCDLVEIIDVRFNALDPTQIIIEVNNNNPDEIFSYPGFRILDTEGSQIGEEEVFFFGITQESVHTVTHNLENVEPGQMLDLVLELWVGFYDEMACTFNVTTELRPDTECAEIIFSANAIPDVFGADDLQLDIYNEEGTSVQTLNFYLDPDTPYFSTEICLSIGCYNVQLITNDAVISNDMTVGFSEYSLGEVQIHTVNVGSAFAEFPLEIFGGCDIQTSIDHIESVDLTLYPNPCHGVLKFDQIISGQIFSATGQLVDEVLNVSQLNVAEFPAGIYVLKTQNSSYRFAVE